MIDQQLIDRFNAKWKADPATGCWLWTASASTNGYGQIKLPKQRKQILAHRLSYLIHRGEIGALCVCHRCDTPLCVNPEHLFLGTQKDNLQDMAAKDRHLRGERGTAVVLTEEQVLKMLEMLKTEMSQASIARAFGVSQMTVSRIKLGRRWKYLGFEPGQPAPVVKPHLKPKQIKQIKAMLAAGVTGLAIAKALDVSESTVSRIRNGLRWTAV
jgi:DNA-binding CsgD family transcriptional regulator